MAYCEIPPQEKLGLINILASELNKDITVLKDFKTFSNFMYDIFISKNASPEKAISLVKFLPEAVGHYRLHSEENKKKFRDNKISMDEIDDIDASFTNYDEIIKYLGKENMASTHGNRKSESWLKIEKFYVWKCDSLRRKANSLNCHINYDDGWFIYEQAKGLITKINCLLLYEVEEFISKINFDSDKEKFRKEIIPAAPNNIEIFPEISALDYGQSLQVQNLDFTGLDEKFVIFVKSKEDKNLGIGENLSIDIFYKKIITEIPDKFPDRHQSTLEILRKKARGEVQDQTPLIFSKRGYLADLRRKALEECQTQFPNLCFDSTIISYKTYDLNPACFRSFEELYEDYVATELDADIQEFKKRK